MNKKESGKFQGMVKLLIDTSSLIAYKNNRVYPLIYSSFYVTPCVLRELRKKDFCYYSEIKTSLTVIPSKYKFNSADAQIKNIKKNDKEICVVTEDRELKRITKGVSLQSLLFNNKVNFKR